MYVCISGNCLLRPCVTIVSALHRFVSRTFHRMPRSLPPVYTPLPSIASFLRRGASVAISMERALAALSRRYPVHDVVFYDCGTSALQVALGLASSSYPSPGPPVVALPAWSCPDLGTAALAIGASMRLYDVVPYTLSPSLPSVERALAQGAEVLVVPHFLGRLVDMNAMAGVAKRYGAILIEDAAQHAGGRFEGVVGGGHAARSMISFGRGKGLNAGGGGVLLRKRDAHIPRPDRIPVPTSAGWIRDVAVNWATDWLSHPALFGVPSSLSVLRIGETIFRLPRPVAGIPLASLQLIPWMLDDESRQLEIRRANEAWYEDALQRNPALGCLALARPVDSGALRYPVLLPQGPSDAAAQARWRKLGVVKSYPRTLLDYPEIRQACLNGHESFPGAEQLARGLYTLPTHGAVSRDDRMRILAALQSFIEEASRKAKRSP
jgi:dTDP-4-amino-4,6-dideoxygalactose transaminase